ncbi:hypothetical protein EAH_00029190 [Eimeria acervulina]|uniref:Uncharacterized protein n=1 Tax=Eimeria acervulina TaxID=5801 RepID=U6GVL6_EIMAC|nr:hypothetical protein EAH_00029190 [Eimeria acervulina]CDI82584.1 hypothetical protein EAH_00029190 [Eimeria acervulina]
MHLEDCVYPVRETPPALLAANKPARQAVHSLMWRQEWSSSSTRACPIMERDCPEIKASIVLRKEKAMNTLMVDANGVNSNCLATGLVQVQRLVGWSKDDVVFAFRSINALLEGRLLFWDCSEAFLLATFYLTVRTLTSRRMSLGWPDSCNWDALEHASLYCGDIGMEGYTMVAEA